MRNKIAQKKILCCFPLEVKSRDLNPRLHLGLQSIKEGYSCLIGTKSNVIKKMFEQDSPFIYFDKGLNAMDEDFYRRVKASNGLIVSLDEEGGVANEKLYETELLRRNKENILQFVDLIFTWGDKQKKILVKNTTFPGNKIVVSGHPRFDLCKPKFKPFQSALLKKHTVLNGEYILINSTFTAANTILSFDEEIKFRIEARGDNSLDIEYERLLYSYRKLLIKYFYEAIKQIHNEYPNLTIVFRPHPGENIIYYKELFKDINNVIVTQDGSVQEWISESLMVFHHDCTTAIEAFLSEKFVTSYCRINDEDYVQDLPIKISYLVNNQDQLMEIIKQYKKTSFKIENRKESLEYIRPIIANVDFEASEVIFRAIKKISFSCVNVRKKIKILTFQKFILKFIVKVKNKFFEYIFWKNKLRSRQKLKFPGLSQEEIQFKIYLFTKIDKDIPELNIKKINNDTYYISSKKSRLNKE